MAGALRSGLRWLPVIAVVGAMAALGAAAPAAHASTPTTDWPQLQGNAAHTGTDTGETSVTAANVGQLSVAWTAPLPGVSNWQTPVVGGAVYVASADYSNAPFRFYVSAFDAANGTQLWQAPLPGQVLGTPSVQDGLVLVAVREGTVRRPRGLVLALNSTTGATEWTRRVGRPSTDTTVTTTPRRAYVALGTGQVEAIGMAHGFKIWISPVLPGSASCTEMSAPSVAGQLIVVGDGGASVSAVHEKAGTLAWSDTLAPGACGSSTANWLPAIRGRTVYAGLANSVAALNLDTGTVVWNNQSVTGVIFPLSVTSTAVITGPDGGLALTALSRSDGSVLWQQALSRQVAGTATFGALTWGMSQESSGLNVQAVAFDSVTGNQDYASAPFSYIAPGGLTPVVTAGRVYVNLGDRLVCLALAGTT